MESGDDCIENIKEKQKLSLRNWTKYIYLIIENNLRKISQHLYWKLSDKN